MRAVIIATGEAPGVAPLNHRNPEPLLPVMDRPFIQHIVEYFLNLGITRFDFVLSHLPEKLEHFLGDGKRWGCSFTFHLARDSQRPYRVLKVIDLSSTDGQPVLLGSADRLPFLSKEMLEQPAERLPVLFTRSKTDAEEGAARHSWTGWAVATPEQLAAAPADATELELFASLSPVGGGHSSEVEVSRCVSVRNFADILATHHDLLDAKLESLLVNGREVDPGIWLSRNVMLHPTAQLLAPVYIDEDCSIGAGARIGPHAVVGNGCVLDARCTVTNSVIFPGSYVGEALELEDVLVDKNRLINARFGAAVTIPDQFLLGSLTDSHLVPLAQRLFSRTAALSLLTLSSPVWLMLALYFKARRGTALQRKNVVCLPAPAGEGSEKTFSLLSFVPFPEADAAAPAELPSLYHLFLRFLPALVNIVKGDLSFVGVPPRTPEEVKILSDDWKALYLHSKPGVVSEAMIRYGSSPTEDELYAADTVYAATASWKYDLSLLFRYLSRMLFGTRQFQEEPVEIT